jgi:hypothetical protein
MKGGPSLVGSLSLSCNSTRDFCPALAALVGPVQNIFFLTVHYFNSFVPITQQAGQAAVLDRLYVSLGMASKKEKVSKGNGKRGKI